MLCRSEFEVSRLRDFWQHSRPGRPLMSSYTDEGSGNVKPLSKFPAYAPRCLLSRYNRCADSTVACPEYSASSGINIRARLHSTSGLHTLDSQRMPLSEQILTARQQFLKDTLRIMLFGNVPQSFLVSLPIPSKHILVPSRIVHVDIPMCQPLLLTPLLHISLERFS